jgi:putative nucleotidyltransferase with HDIG domain
MPTITLQDVMNKVEQLPPLPQAALRVSRLMEEEDSNADRIAGVIRLDAAFTSHVLRLCNSAAYGFSRRISTVKEAVAILGFATLKSMVYLILAKSALDHAVPGYALDRGALWMNSLSCAVYAKHIAQKEKITDLELAFTGGLLRDIGKIILGDFVGESYGKIEEVAVSARLDYLMAEDKVLSFNHCRAGKHLAERWNLPGNLVQVIQYHHHPSKMPHSLNPMDGKLVTAVHLADLFASMLGKGVGRDGMMYALDGPALAKFGFKCAEGDKLEGLMSELIDLQPIIQSLIDTLAGMDVSS